MKNYLIMFSDLFVFASSLSLDLSENSRPLANLLFPYCPRFLQQMRSQIGCKRSPDCSGWLATNWENLEHISFLTCPSFLP